jgi:hypothetical protein
LEGKEEKEKEAEVKEVKETRRGRAEVKEVRARKEKAKEKESLKVSLKEEKSTLLRRSMISSGRRSTLRRRNGMKEKEHGKRSRSLRHRRRL